MLIWRGFCPIEPLEKPETCPVGLLKAWLEFAGIESGAILRPIAKSGPIRSRGLGDRAVVLITKRSVGYAGFSSEDLGGHSLRAGLATSAAELASMGGRTAGVISYLVDS